MQFVDEHFSTEESPIVTNYLIRTTEHRRCKNCFHESPFNDSAYVLHLSLGFNKQKDSIQEMIQRALVDTKLKDCHICQKDTYHQGNIVVDSTSRVLIVQIKRYSTTLLKNVWIPEQIWKCL